MARISINESASSRHFSFNWRSIPGKLVKSTEIEANMMKRSFSFTWRSIPGKLVKSTKIEANMIKGSFSFNWRSIPGKLVNSTEIEANMIMRSFEVETVLLNQSVLYLGKLYPCPTEMNTNCTNCIFDLKESI